MLYRTPRCLRLCTLALPCAVVLLLALTASASAHCTDDPPAKPQVASPPETPTAGASQAPMRNPALPYAIAYTPTDRKARGGITYNSMSEVILSQLILKLGSKGLVRSDSMTGGCCKVEFELLEVSRRWNEMSLASVMTATLTVRDASGRRVYSKGYRAEGKKDLVEWNGASVKLAAEGLAEDIGNDADLIRALSGAGLASSPPAPVVAEVAVNSVPDTAEVQINGASSGNTPLKLTLTPGEYRIAVTKQGYKAWERRLKVGSGGTMQVNAVLTALPSSAQAQ